ncbi:MAG: HDOD domain-containing protein [Sterolibacterium sp.]|nr:HDOD domain-containing protein [Sterolibacterium sp.]
MIAAAKLSAVDALLENAVRDIGIPPRPAILDSIDFEMHKEEPDMLHLSKLISSDVAIAAGLIATANSPYFGFRRRVRSVRDTLMMLGLDVASRAVAGLILRKLFPSTLVLERFWDASACIARLSGWLAQHPEHGIRIRADDAYTFGLFRDCGIPVMMKRFPHYHDALKAANESREIDFTTVEEAHCPTNHVVIGYLLARSWKLPEETCLAIRHHHDCQSLREPGRSSLLPVATLGLIATVHLAEHLFQHHTGLSQTQEWIKSGDVCMQLLDISAEKLGRLYEECGQIIADD